MKPVNIKEAKSLVMKYQTTSESKLRSIENDLVSRDERASMFDIATACTGFGYHHSCTLCAATILDGIKHNCGNCIYQTKGGCISDDNRLTYTAIEDASTIAELISAFRARAKHIKNILKAFND